MRRYPAGTNIFGYEYSIDDGKTFGKSSKNYHKCRKKAKPKTSIPLNEAEELVESIAGFLTKAQFIALAELSDNDPRALDDAIQAKCQEIAPELFGD